MPNPLDGESYEGDINAWKADNFELDGVKTKALSDTLNNHYFTSSGRANNECQCNEAIKTGDILMISDEKVIGLADAWPVAVTKAHGDLHDLAEGSTWDDIREYDAKVVNGLAVATMMAELLEWELARG